MPLPAEMEAQLSTAGVEAGDVDDFSEALEELRQDGDTLTVSYNAGTGEVTGDFTQTVTTARQFVAKVRLDQGGQRAGVRTKTIEVIT